MGKRFAFAISLVVIAILLNLIGIIEWMLTTIIFILMFPILSFSIFFSFASSRKKTRKYT